MFNPNEKLTVRDLTRSEQKVLLEMLETEHIPKIRKLINKMKVAMFLYFFFLFLIVVITTYQFRIDGKFTTGTMVYVVGIVIATFFFSFVLKTLRNARNMQKHNLKITEDLRAILKQESEGDK